MFDWLRQQGFITKLFVYLIFAVIYNLSIYFFGIYMLKDDLTKLTTFFIVAYVSMFVISILIFVIEFAYEEKYTVFIKILLFLFICPIYGVICVYPGLMMVGAHEMQLAVNALNSANVQVVK